MAAKAKMTEDDLMDAVDELAHKLRDVENRWPFVLGQAFPDLESRAQTMNRLIESAAGAQRMILASVALGADERRIRAQLTGADQ